MSRDAARKARRNAFNPDLTKAYTDEESNPPDWLDLATTITQLKADVRTKIDEATEAFVTEPDIRRAIARRDHAATQLRGSIDTINKMVNRLNLIAPHQRFTQAGLDADELLRPLFRSARQPS